VDRWLHFHHAQSHTLALVMSGPGVGSPASTECAADIVSPVSTSVETIKAKKDPPVVEG
jgi:hypothetical protein